MILFPKRDGKPKKGEIADSTLERLKSAEAEKQNINKHVFTKTSTKLREKPQKITKEMLGLKAYRKLRQLAVNKKFKGKREMKAKEQAEKEAAEKK